MRHAFANTSTYHGKAVRYNPTPLKAKSTRNRGDCRFYYGKKESRTMFWIGVHNLLSHCLYQSSIDDSFYYLFCIRENRPLWSYETVTPRKKDLKSLVIMNDLLTNLVSIFKQCLPQSLIDLRWCQTSLQFAMSCPSRHYAGRSLQVKYWHLISS